MADVVVHSPFRINKHCLCYCIYVVNYLCASAYNSDFIKKEDDSDLKNDLKCHHSSTFTYRREGMSENTANINGSLLTWVNDLFVSEEI